MRDGVYAILVFLAAAVVGLTILDYDQGIRLEALEHRVAVLEQMK